MCFGFVSIPIRLFLLLCLGTFLVQMQCVPVPLSILPSCLRTADVVLAKPALGFCLQHFCRPELPQSTEMKGLSPVLQEHRGMFSVDSFIYFDLVL